MYDETSSLMVSSYSSDVDGTLMVCLDALPIGNEGNFEGYVAMES